MRSLLRLNKGGVIIGLEGAHSACAGPLVQLLLEEGAPVRVCFEAGELLDAPEDARVVLLHAARDAELLNLARPVVAERRLQVLVWLGPGDRRELSRRARDFLDWMQESVDVPDFVPAYAEQALRRALEEGTSISWEGPPLRDLIPDAAVLLPDRVDEKGAITAMRTGPVVIRRPRDLDEVARFEDMRRKAGGTFGIIWDDPVVLPGGTKRIIEPLDWEVAAEWLETAGVDEPRIEAARLHLDPVVVSRRAGREPPPLIALKPHLDVPTLRKAREADALREQRPHPRAVAEEPTGTYRKWWEETIRICDPVGPPEDPALIVPRPVPRSGWVPLVNLLLSPLEPPILVAGAPGSGVSTELLSSSLQLHEEHCVVMFDVWEHFASGVRDPTAFERLTSLEVALLLGMAAIRVGRDRWGVRWGRELRWLSEAIRELTGTVFDVERLASALAGARAPDAKMTTVETWTMPLGMRNDSSLDDTGVRARPYLKTALQLIVKELRVFTGRNVTFVVDGLGRLRQPPLIQDLVDSLSRSLPDAALVLAVRPGLLIRIQDVFSVRTDVQLVEDIPVIDVQDPTKYGSGIGFFRELLERRFATNPYDRPAIPEDVLDRLCWGSGGRPRECLQLVRELARRAFNGPRERLYELATGVLIDRTKELAAHVTYEGHALLRSLVRGVVENLPDDHTVDDLKSLGLLRSYPTPEGGSRALPHPLLIEGLLDG